MKYCIGCKWLKYEEPVASSQGSSWTGSYGAEDAAMSCRRGHWQVLFNKESTRDTFRIAMESAATCEDFDERDLEEEERDRQAKLKQEADEAARRESARLVEPLYCSFCGETGKPLVQGPSVYICSVCISTAKELMEEGETVKVKGDLK